MSASTPPITFLINNRDRTPGEDALAFSFEIPYLTELEQCTYTAAVDCVTSENALPIIQFGFNDQLWFEYNGVQHSVILQEGNVDVYDLATELKTTFQLLNAGFDVVFDSKQFKLLLTVPATVSFVLLRVHPSPLQPLDYNVTDRTDRALEVLGWTFDANDRLEFSGGVSGYVWVPPNIVRVRPSAWLHLHCNQPIDRTYTSNKSEPGPLARFPFLHPFGTVDHYQKVQPTSFTLANPGGLVLSFYITDEWAMRRLMGPGKNMVLGFQLSLSKLGSY